MIGQLNIVFFEDKYSACAHLLPFEELLEFLEIRCSDALSPCGLDVVINEMRYLKWKWKTVSLPAMQADGKWHARDGKFRYWQRDAAPPCNG
jgi:hypothetical protein